jgi:hypothetical protein
MFCKMSLSDKTPLNLFMALILAAFCFIAPAYGASGGLVTSEPLDAPTRPIVQQQAPAQSAPPTTYSQPQAAPTTTYSQPQSAPSTTYSQPQAAPTTTYSQPQSAPSTTYSQPQAAPTTTYSQQQPSSSNSVQTTTTPFSTEQRSTSGAKYSPQATAMLLNYCRESLYKIIEFNDRTVLDEEYGKLINNIDITRIQDDEAAKLIEALLRELSALKLNDVERQALADAYNREIRASVLTAFKGAAFPKMGDVAEVVGTPGAIACQAIVAIASGVGTYKKDIAHKQNQISDRLMELKADELNRLTVLRTQFFDTEYTLYKRYNLPDRLNLKEVQMAQYIKVLADEDSSRRVERLERLKDDFDAFPPFWYQMGKAAQEAGLDDKALEYYAHFESTCAHVFREDLDYVMLCMHRILLRDVDKDADQIRKDLRSIEQNTKYYYKWENILFAALTYYQLGDLEDARRLIRTSVNEGYCIDLHQEILTEMESAAARETLGEKAEDLVDKVDAGAIDALRRVGSQQQVEALRALGKTLSNISLSVSLRSHAGETISYLVPGYNLYSVGRTVVKGGAYYDNCVVNMPDAWFAGGKTKVKVVFRGRTYKAASVSRNKKEKMVDVVFSRVLKQSDVVEKKQQWPITVHIENKGIVLDVGFEIRPVTPQLQKLRPELSMDEPFFEMKTIDYAGRTYQIRDGLITYGE